MAVAAPIPPRTRVPPNSGTPRRTRRSVEARVNWRLLPTDLAYAREMLLPMTLGMLVLLLALAGNFVYWAINSIVNKGMAAGPVLRLFLLAMPGFSGQGIPVGVILAVCLVLNRAVRDNEIIALRVGGASVVRVIAPFLVVAFAASITDWWVVEKVAPYTNSLAEKTLMTVMNGSAAPLFEDDRYFRAGSYCFYVGHVENEGDHSSRPILYNVMIYVRDSQALGGLSAQTMYPTVYLAQSAEQEARNHSIWVLKNVTQHHFGDDGQLISETQTDTLRINVGRELSTYWSEQKQPWSMTSDELSRQINDLKSSAFDPAQVSAMEVDYYRRRGALPFACFVMALLAAPMALRFARQGSFAGLVCAFGLAFFWQGFDGWLRALGIAGYLPPIAAAWGTNVLFILLALCFLRRER